MRVSFTPYGLAEVFDATDIEAVWFALLSSSIWATTQSLLKEYERAIPAKSNYYYTLIDSLIRTGRLQDINPSDIASYNLQSAGPVGRDPLGAAFHSGQLCLASKEEAASATVTSRADGYGILVDSSIKPAHINSGNPPGEDPVESHVYHNGDIINLDWLRRFFSYEKYVVIYDKYLGRDSPEFIADVLCTVQPKADIHVITSGKAGHGAANADIEARISAQLPRCNISLHSMTPGTFKAFHDRWMYAGSRYEVKFSAGLDHFSRSRGAWIAQDCEVVVRNIYSSQRNRTFYVDGGHQINQRCS